MARPRHPYSFLISLVVLGVLLLVPAGASAASCDWRNMIDAAANNRQISPHSTACYQRALSELPGDVDVYAPEARTGLIVAMQRDAGIKAKVDGTPVSREVQSAQPSAVSAVVRGPVTNLLEGLGPSHVDEVPAPVVALGGLAALLLLAGLGTSLARARTRRLSR